MMGQKEIEDKSRIDLKDNKGTFIIKELTEVAKEGGGFVDYYFNKTGGDCSFSKKGLC